MEINSAQKARMVKKIRDALGGNEAKTRAHDPQRMKEAAELYPNFTYVENAYEACEGADVVVLFTEWNQYRALDLVELKAKMKGAIFVDLRNVYSPKQIRDAGFEYYGLGRV